jgi:hypothetical protein
MYNGFSPHIWNEKDTPTTRFFELFTDNKSVSEKREAEVEKSSLTDIKIRNYCEKSISPQQKSFHASKFYEWKSFLGEVSHEAGV